MSQHYSDPKREQEPYALPNVEVWYERASHIPPMECPAIHEDMEDHTEECSGWYWQACFPGCLPDGEPMGPFDTEAEALVDAQDGAGDDDGECVCLDAQDANRTFFRR